MAQQKLAATDNRDANQDQLFSLFTCLPTASGCHFLRSGDFGTSPFFGQHPVKQSA
jgi:hypothetical protein